MSTPTQATAQYALERNIVDIRNLVNSNPILVGEVEHFVCCVPAGKNVTGYHPRLEREALKDAVPLRKDDRTRVFHSVHKFANLSVNLLVNTIQL